MSTNSSVVIKTSTLPISPAIKIQGDRTRTPSTGGVSKIVHNPADPAPSPDVNNNLGSLVNAQFNLYNPGFCK